MSHNPGDVFIRLGEALKVTTTLLDMVFTFRLPTSLCSEAMAEFTTEAVTASWRLNAMAECTL